MNRHAADFWGDPMRAMPVMPPWVFGPGTMGRLVLQIALREMAAHAARQHALALTTFEAMLKAESLAALAHTEIAYLEQSLQLALDTGERLMARKTRADQDRLVCLPIE